MENAAEQKKMRWKKSALFLIIATCLVIGLASLSNNKDMSGDIRPIDLDVVKAKMKAKDTFTLIITSDACQYCDDMYKMLDDYLVDHEVILYELKIDKPTPEEKDAYVHDLTKVFPSYVGTPNLFYIENGETISQFDNMNYDLTEDYFNNWVQKYKMEK